MADPKPDWVRWYPAKWLSGVLHLTNEQRGVYVQVINVILDLGSCPDDPRYIGRLCNARANSARRIVDELVAVGKLFRDGGKLRQKRAETELILAQNSSNVGTKMALARWKSRKPNDIAHATGTCKPESRMDSPLLSPLLEQPTAPPAKPSSPKKRTLRGSRIPDGWELTDERLADADAAGLTPAQARDQHGRFVDYWRAAPGAKGVKADWPATWRNWCRRAVDDIAKHAAARGNGAAHSDKAVPIHTRNRDAGDLRRRGIDPYSTEEDDVARRKH